jgi:hypothetical protein
LKTVTIQTSLSPESLLELRKQLQRVFTHDLSSNSYCVLLAEFAADDLLGQRFGQALPGKLGRPVNNWMAHNTRRAEWISTYSIDILR